MTARIYNLPLFKLPFLFLCAFFPALGFAEGGEVLQGAAAIISASSPIFMAASQASQSISQAQMAASSAMFQATTAADVARYQADAMRDTSIFQTITAAQVAESNNRYATQRLDMQLREMHDNFQQNFELSRDAYKANMNFKYQQLALQEKKMNLDLELERQKLKQDLVKSGMSQGYNDVGGVKLASTYTSNQEIARSMKEPTLRLLSSTKVGKDKALNSGFLARNLASGSTRSRRNVASDLSLFKSSMPGRSIASEAGLIPHAQRDQGSSVPMRVHGEINR